MRFPCIEVVQGDKTFYLTTLDAAILSRVSYAAVRGKDDEEGAVQRLLSPKRISSIRDFILRGGDFPSAVVLNWKSDIVFQNGHIEVDVGARAAQLIDGQHRVEGLREALIENPRLAEYPVPVSIYSNLGTRDCAEIFLAINTEQKPVPRSLVFDLYGVVSEDYADPTITRSQDIARFLNEDERSPYRGDIKFPGDPQRKGGVALSTVVTSLKPLVEDKGTLAQVGIHSLEQQQKVVLNFLSSIANAHAGEWTDRKNAFMYAAGFAGALEFFSKKLIQYCSGKKSFTEETIDDVLALPRGIFINQSDLAGKGGSAAQRLVYDRLNDVFQPKDVDQDFEI